MHPLVYHSQIFCFSDVIVGVLVFIVVDLVESIQFTNKMCSSLPAVEAENKK
jgi:hypothetical protein